MKSRELKSRVVERSVYTMRMYVLGFADGDGSVIKRVLRISNTNLENLKYIVKLLKFLGVNIEPSDIKVSRVKGQRKVIRGKVFTVKKDIYYINIPLEIFTRRVGLSIKVLKKF